MAHRITLHGFTPAVDTFEFGQYCVNAKDCRTLSSLLKLSQKHVCQPLTSIVFQKHNIPSSQKPWTTKYYHKAIVVTQFFPTDGLSQTTRSTPSPRQRNMWSSVMSSMSDEAFIGPVPCSCRNTVQSSVSALICALTSYLQREMSKDAVWTIPRKDAFGHVVLMCYQSLEGPLSPPIAKLSSLCPFSLLHLLACILKLSTIVCKLLQRLSKSGIALVVMVKLAQSC